MSLADPKPLREQDPGTVFGSVADVCRLVPVPRSSIYDLARAGRIPGVVRVGRRLLFDMYVVRRWLEAGGDRGGER